MIIDPHSFENFYNILTAVVVPRPIAFVSSISTRGLVNLAPFSFFNAVSGYPPTIVISIGHHSNGKMKDTLENILETEEFVVNAVVDDIAEAMNRTAADYPPDFDEIQLAGLTQVATQLLKPPRVAESPVNLECRLTKTIPIGDENHPSTLIIGEVALAHIRDSLINGHRVDNSQLKAVGRLAGNMYTRTNDTFDMVRPVYES